MTTTEILTWVRLGSELITILGVPIANVIRLFRDSGGSDADAELLAQHWASLAASIEARIKVLRGAGA